MAVDAEILLPCLYGPFAESVSLRVVGHWEAQVDVELSVQLLGEFGSELSTMVRGDMCGESIKPLNLVNVCVRNVCCCAGCCCWKVVLYLCQPVCDYENCVEDVWLWSFTNEVHSYFFKRSFSGRHWYQLCLPAVPVCLALLKLDTSCYIICNIFSPSFPYEVSWGQLLSSVTSPVSAHLTIMVRSKHVESVFLWNLQQYIPFVPLEASIASSSISPALPSLSFSSSTRSSSCPSSQNFASIPDSSSRGHLDRPSGELILVPGR